jgi:type IV pilus assembly protein PilA
MRNEKGFTFIELMIVISIIGILAAIAIPQFSAYRDRAYRTEAYSLFEGAKKNITEFYEYRGIFPKDNAEAGLPAPENIKGKYVKSITVLNGTVVVEFYPNYNRPARGRGISGEVITLQPLVLADDPTGPVLWAGSREVKRYIQEGYILPGQENIEKK